jgi:hypothetical protein
MPLLLWGCNSRTALILLQERGPYAPNSLLDLLPLRPSLCNLLAPSITQSNECFSLIYRRERRACSQSCSW